MSKILVVEDDRNLLDTLEYNLHREDHEVVTSEDGEEAVEVARREKRGTARTCRAPHSE